MALLRARISSILLNQSQSSAFLGRSFATGTTKWFNVKKGFGFIKPDVEGEPDLFVHQTAIQASGFRFLNEAEKVTYDVERTDKGPQAANVRDATGKPFARPYTNPNPSFQSGDNDGAAGGGGGLSSPRERRPSNSVGNSIGGTGSLPVEARPNWSDSPSATSSGAPPPPSSSSTRPAPRPRTPRTTTSPTSASSQSVSSAPVKE